jgi:hypothetical protein
VQDGNGVLDREEVRNLLQTDVRCTAGICFVAQVRKVEGGRHPPAVPVVTWPEECTGGHRVSVVALLLYLKWKLEVGCGEYRLPVKGFACTAPPPPHTHSLCDGTAPYMCVCT